MKRIVKILICVITIIYILIANSIYKNNIIYKYNEETIKNLEMKDISVEDDRFLINSGNSSILLDTAFKDAGYMYVRISDLSTEKLDIYLSDKNGDINALKKSGNIEKLCNGINIFGIENKNIQKIIIADGYGTIFNIESIMFCKKANMGYSLAFGYLMIIFIFFVIIGGLKGGNKFSVFNRVFLLSLLLPTISFFLIKPYLKNENNEQRELAEMPKLDIVNIENYPKLYDQYYNDHVPYRNLFLCINADIKYNVLKTVNSQKVVKGVDDWLFLKETVGDYEGTNLYNKYQLKAILDNTNKVNERFKNNGTDFLIMIFPNKNSVHNDKMYDYYNEATEKRIDQILNYLKANNSQVKICYPVDELVKAKKISDVYLHGDTHCNIYGACVAANAVYSMLGEADVVPAPEEKLYNSVDLKRMLNISNVSETAPTINNFDFIKPSKKYKNVLCLCDSFGSRLQNSFDKKFEKVTYVKWDTEYNDKTLNTDEYDLVICESVERYVFRFTNFK